MACIFKAADETSAVVYFLNNLLLEEPELGLEITALTPTDHPAIITLIDERIESYHPDHAAFYLYECQLEGQHLSYIDGLELAKRWLSTHGDQGLSLVSEKAKGLKFVLRT